MKQAELDTVRAASRREREHATFRTPQTCVCRGCERDRITIARHIPDLLAFIDDAIAQPRRAHHDHGDID